MEKRIAEYVMKEMIDYKEIKTKFKELFRPHPYIIRRDSYATTAEFGAVYECFNRGNNQTLTLERLRDLVWLPVDMFYQDQPEMWSSKAT